MTLKRFSDFNINEAKKAKFKVGDDVLVIKDNTSDDKKRSLKLNSEHTIKSIDYLSGWLKFEDDKYFHNPENFQKIINESNNLKNSNPALWHQIQVAKKVLNTNDVMAKVMGGMTKEEARELLKKHNIKFKEINEEHGFEEYTGGIGDRYIDSEGNEFVVRDKVKGGVTLKGQGGEKEVATSDLKHMTKIEKKVNELFITDGEVDKDNNNIYINKYNNKTVTLPIIPDAIQIISNNKDAIKFTNKDELVKFIEEQRYFSAHFSHCFYDMDEYKAWSDSGNSVLSDDAKNSLLLFETGGEIVMCWDEKNKVGYVVPANSQNESNGEIEKHKITIETDVSGADILVKMLNHIKNIGNIGHSFTIMVDPDGDKDYKKPFGWDGDGSMRIYDIKDEKIIDEEVSEFFKSPFTSASDKNLKFSERFFNDFLNKPLLNGVISDVSIYNRNDEPFLQLIIESDVNNEKDYKFYNYIMKEDTWENIDVSKLTDEDKKTLSTISKLVNSKTKFTDINNF